jgi:hypothetical protein
MSRERSAARRLAAAASAAAFVAAGPAGATLLVYEPFDYDAGTVLDATPATGLNLTGSYVPLGVLAQQKLVASSPGLTYGSLLGAPVAAGNRANDVAGVTAAGATVSVDQDVPAPAGSAIYWSALFTFDDSTNGNRHASITFTDDASGDALTFGEAVVGSRAVRVSAATAATGGLLAAGADDSFSDGQTLLLIGRYVNSPAADGDRLELIGYDTADADLLPASFDPADPQAEFAFSLDGLDIDLVQITSITFTIRGDDNNFVDELRIGDSYASVAVPEPGALAALLLGIAGLAARASSGRVRLSV